MAGAVSRISSKIKQIQLKSRRRKMFEHVPFAEVKFGIHLNRMQISKFSGKEKFPKFSSLSLKCN